MIFDGLGGRNEKLDIKWQPFFTIFNIFTPKFKKFPYKLLSSQIQRIKPLKLERTTEDNIIFKSGGRIMIFREKYTPGIAKKMSLGSSNIFSRELFFRNWFSEELAQTFPTLPYLEHKQLICRNQLGVRCSIYLLITI